MPADVLLIILLGALGGAALPLAFWLRAQKRIRHLEMTLLTQAADGDRYEELRDLLQQLAAQTGELADHQALLARRLGDRGDQLPSARADQGRAVTPH